MLELVNTFFDTRNDPGQISVTDEQREKLMQLHPATLSELANEDGPIVWVLLIPTNKQIMEQFLNGEISEKQLLDLAQPGESCQSLYLCSASVLPEFRKQGLARKVTIGAINSIRAQYSISTLYFWPFSSEGRALAQSIADELGIELLERTAHSRKKALNP